MPEAVTNDGSLAILYRDLAADLDRIVRCNVRACDEVIEEACQNAWVALIARRDEVIPGTELGWLATTATREALLRERTARREVPLEPEHEGKLVEVSFASGPDRALELRERLAEVRVLPARQHRMVMLQGFGYRYEEIAEITGDSRRTVERQLLRARRRLAG
ncbi:MAG TPA: sigma factor-like helix-turn-helix DNA-binding protein [Solirubrobacteraceae bacterium]|nr:sigma factor-like helix-turn-helix DNA-binding protein [Solirubrobacteraceae bacterium]